MESHGCQNKRRKVDPPTDPPTWNAVVALLEPLAIASNVLGILKSEAVTDMDTLADMDTDDLHAMGMRRGDVRKVRKAVKKACGDKEHEAFQEAEAIRKALKEAKAQEKEALATVDQDELVTQHAREADKDGGVLTGAELQRATRRTNAGAAFEPDVKVVIARSQALFGCTTAPKAVQRTVAQDELVTQHAREADKDGGVLTGAELQRATRRTNAGAAFEPDVKVVMARSQALFGCVDQDELVTQHAREADKDGGVLTGAELQRATRRTNAGAAFEPDVKVVMARSQALFGCTTALKAVQ